MLNLNITAPSQQSPYFHQQIQVQYRLFIVIQKQYLLMNPASLQRQLATNFIRQGHIFKRSKFLKAWQDRQLVLTVNYLFIFQNRSRKELLDTIDLNEIRNYKSYVRKEEDVLTNCIKIRTQHHMYYLGFASVLEKWTWLVTLERLMDVKLIGRTHYNCQEWIATRGFPSQVDFQNKEKDKGEKKVEKVPVESVEKALQRNDAEVQRLKKLLDEQEQSFEAALKQKYKELNMIEEHMRQREKEYLLLSDKLNASLDQANRRVKAAQQRVLQAENKAKNTQIATNINIIQTAIASFVEQEGDNRQKIETLAAVTLENQKLKAEVTTLGLKLQQQKEILASQLARSQQTIKEKEEALEKSRAANQVPDKKDLPLTNHTIRSSFQFEIVQSMLGYSLSQEAKPQLTLRAVIIPQQAPSRAIKPQSPAKPVQQSRIRPVHFVQTILGFSLPVHQEKDLHTDGIVQPNKPNESIWSEKKELEQAPKEIPETKVEEAMIISREEVYTGIDELNTQIQLLTQKIFGLEQQKQQQRQEIQALRSQLADEKTRCENVKQYNDSAVDQAKRNYYENQTLRKNIAQRAEVEGALRKELAQMTSKLQSVLVQKTLLAQAPVSSTNQEISDKELTLLQEKLRLQQAKTAELTADTQSLKDKLQRIIQEQLVLKQQFLEKARKASEHQHLAKLNAELTVSNDHLRDRVQLSQKQLNQAKSQLEQIKTGISAKPSRVALPETGHIIRSSHKFDMVESMLGYGLSPEAKKNVHIKAAIIEEAPLSPQRKVEQNKGKNGLQPTHSKVDEVETILGFAIPPSRHAEIHTKGIVEPSKPSKETLEALRLAEQLQSLRLTSCQLKEELEVIKKASSFQKELFQLEKQQAQSAFRESEERHIQEKQALDIKLKEYQELYAQLAAKLSDIQSKPIEISPKKEEKPESAVSTDILKPSMLKAKSSTTEDVPVWVKVRTEQQKPAITQPKEPQVQSPPSGPRVSRVSQMKKLFEGFNKGP